MSAHYRGSRFESHGLTVCRMNTPAHVIVNAALLGHRATPKEWVAAALGGALPDAPMLASISMKRS